MSCSENSCIPKIIHYCWFGKGKKPELAERCIQSWKRYLPDYKIIEWNEDNTDIVNEIPYVKEAYEKEKYAFVSDYFRLKVLFQYGGVYFDTDYEVLQPIEHLFQKGKIVSGFESDGSLLTAIIACEKENPIIGEFIEQYQQRHFCNKNNTLDLEPINVGFSNLLEKYGVDLTQNIYQETTSNIVIYPIDILCGFDTKYWHERITSNTIGVHHMSNSWATPEMKKHIKKILFLQKLLGFDLYDKVKDLVKGV